MENEQLTFQEFCDCVEPELEFKGYEIFLEFSEELKKKVYAQYLDDTKYDCSKNNKETICFHWFLEEFLIIDPLDI